MYEGFVDVSEALRPGVYLLVAKGRVIYVGKSKKPISRINNHRQVWAQKRKKGESWIADTLGIPGVLFDEVHVRHCALDALDRLEQEMIDRYRPAYNIQHRKSGIIRAPISVVIAGIQLELNKAAPKGEPIRRRV